MVELHKITLVEKFNDIGFEWKNHVGYPQDKFYTNDNTKHDLCFGKIPNCILNFARQAFEVFSISLLRQFPGQFIPEHEDKYFKFKEHFPEILEKDIVRYCIFLEDWKPGHYFEYALEPVVRWQAGEYIKIYPGVLHRSSNSGSLPKYTCQITGTEVFK